MDMQALLQNIAEVNALRAGVKRCAMIYHYDQKVSIAHVYGLSETCTLGMDFHNFTHWQARYFADLDVRPAMPEEVLTPDVQAWLDEKRAHRALGVA